MTYPTKSILINGLNTKKEEEANYRGLLNKYFLSKWYLYILFLALFIGLTQLYLQTTQPEYEITGKMLIRPPEGLDTDSPDDWLNRSIGVSGGSEYVANEIETLTSFWLMNSVVDHLDLDRRYYWKKQLATIEVYQDFPVVVDSFSLNQGNSLSFQVIPIDQFTFKIKQEEESGPYQFGQMISLPEGSFQIQRKTDIPLTSESTMHVELLNPQLVASQYLKNLKIGISDTKVQSSILLMSLLDAIPRRGEAILNRLVEEYDILKTKENAEITRNRLVFIDERLNEVGKELKAMESNVEKYKLNNNIVSETTSDLNFVLDNVKQVSAEQKQAELQLSLINSLKDGFSMEGDDFELIPTNLFMVKGELQSLIKPYNDLVLERNMLLETGQPSNPVVQAANQRLQSLRSSIYVAVENAKNELEQKRNTAQSQYQRSMGRLQSVPVKERGLTEKMRRQSITENLYLYLLQKKEESALALASKYSNYLVIDKPHSSLNPVAPKKLTFYLGGAASGLVIPFMLLLLGDLLKDSIKTEKELKGLLPNVPLMGTINHYRGKNKQVLLGKERHLTGERFRSLRTSLQFLRKQESRCILVTSSTGEEGKTFVASNLATSFALTKKSTIFVDFDLRKSGTASLFKEKDGQGLINYLLEEVEIEDIIQQVPTVKHLFYINGGRFVLDSAELLERDKLDTLFAYLRENFDVVIIDSPPVGLIADALLLNEHVTDSLFVVRSGYTRKGVLEDSMELFERNKLVNPSLVLNGVKKKEYVYNKHYKKYGYSYN